MNRNKKGEGRLNEVLAKKYGVSPRLVQSAIAVVKSGNTELIEKIRNGELSATDAEEIMKNVPVNEHAEVLNSLGNSIFVKRCWSLVVE